MPLPKGLENPPLKLVLPKLVGTTVLVAPPTFIPNPPGPKVPILGLPKLLLAALLPRPNKMPVKLLPPRPKLLLPLKLFMLPKLFVLPKLPFFEKFKPPRELGL